MLGPPSGAAFGVFRGFEILQRLLTASCFGRCFGWHIIVFTNLGFLAAAWRGGTGRRLVSDSSRLVQVLGAALQPSSGAVRVPAAPLVPAGGALLARRAALGVLVRLEVLDFDVFFLGSHTISVSLFYWLFG